MSNEPEGDPPPHPYLHGDETFVLDEQTPTDIQLSEFWRWAFADLQVQANREALATFLVAHALSVPRTAMPQNAKHELECPPGIRIGVASQAFLQSPSRNIVAEPRFFPLSRLPAESREILDDSDFPADVYVFCLQTCRDAESYNPLDLSQWAFYPLPRRVLADYGARSLSLTTVRRFKPEPCSFQELSSETSRLFDEEQKLREPREEDRTRDRLTPRTIDDCLQSMAASLASESNEATLHELLSTGLRDLDQVSQLGSVYSKHLSEDAGTDHASEFRRHLEDVRDACEEFIDVQEQIALATEPSDFQQLLADLQRLKLVFADSRLQRRVDTAIRRLYERRPSIEDSTQAANASRLRQAILQLERAAPTCRKGHPMRILEGAKGFTWTCSEFPHCWSRRALTSEQLGRLQEASGETGQPEMARPTSAAEQAPATTTVSPKWAERASQLLRAWRRDESRERRLPAYRIMQDGTIADIIRIWPHTREQLAHAFRVGPDTLERYGDTILTLLRDAERD